MAEPYSVTNSKHYIIYERSFSYQNFKLFNFSSQAVSNPEDTAVRKAFEVKTAEEVERVRRCHLNDLENILAFVFLGFFFILSSPNMIFASWLIRIAALARIAHSCIYLLQVRQPFRAISFYIMYIISLFMGLSSIVYFFYV